MCDEVTGDINLVTSNNEGNYVYIIVYLVSN